MREGEKMVKRSVIILVLLAAAAMGLSTARSDLDLLRAIETNIEENEGSSNKLACCNRCGICDFRLPEFARCRCEDQVLRCHPSCRKCVPTGFGTIGPLYKCLDMSFKACHRNCNHHTATSISAN